MRSPTARWTRLFSAFVGLCATMAATGATPTRVSDVRLWSGPEGTRLVLDLTAPARYEIFTLENPDRVVIDLARAQLSAAASLPAGQGPVKNIRSGPQPGGALRVVLDLDAKQPVKSFTVGPDGNAGHRLVVELPPAAGAGAAPASATAPPAP